MDSVPNISQPVETSRWPYDIVTNSELEPLARLVWLAMSLSVGSSAHEEEYPDRGFPAHHLATVMGVNVQSIGRAAGILVNHGLATRERVAVLGGYETRYYLT